MERPLPGPSRSLLNRRCFLWVSWKRRKEMGPEAVKFSETQ